MTEPVQTEADGVVISAGDTARRGTLIEHAPGAVAFGVPLEHTVNEPEIADHGSRAGVTHRPEQITGAPPCMGPETMRDRVTAGAEGIGTGFDLDPEQIECVCCAHVERRGRDPLETNFRVGMCRATRLRRPHRGLLGSERDETTTCRSQQQDSSNEEAAHHKRNCGALKGSRQERTDRRGKGSAPSAPDSTLRVMSVRLLPVKSLCTAPLPVTAPVVLGISFDADYNDPSTLATPSFRLRWLLHPALNNWAHRGQRPYTAIPEPALELDQARFRELCSIAAVVEPAGPASATLTPQLLGAARRRLAKRGYETRPSRRGVLAATFHRNSVSVAPWSPFAIPSSLLTIDSANAFLRRARENGIPVLDTGKSAPALRAAEHLTIALRCDDAPGRARLYTTHGSERFVDPVEALAICADVDQRVAVDHDVVEAAQVALAGPTGRQGLHPWQDLAVSALHASSTGAILALPPGSGKTVVALHALEEILTPDDLAVAVVPSAVTGQWRSAAQRFVPALRCHVARSAVDITAALAPVQRPSLLVLSHDLAPALHDALRNAAHDVQLAVIIVDEAHVLGTAARRAAALADLRRYARRGWALTGTPGERGEPRFASVASWSLNRPLSAGDLVRRLGPYLITAETPAPCTVSVLTPAVIVSDSASAADQTLVAGTESGFAARAAYEQFRRVTAEKKLHWLTAALRETPRQPTLVFVDTVAVAEKAVALATTAGLQASSLVGAHPLVRTAAAAAFVQGELDVLVCSSASQRGLDLQRAERVICLDLPASSAVLAQRVARAVRIGGPAAVEVVLPYLDGTAEAAFVAMLSPAITAIEHHDVPAPLLLDTPAAITAALQLSATAGNGVPGATQREPAWSSKDGFGDHREAEHETSPSGNCETEYHETEDCKHAYDLERGRLRE